MKLQLAALVLTMAVAVIAAVFAIWPVVADAPWEDSSPPAITQPTGSKDAIRCQGALSFRDTVIAAGRFGGNNPGGLRDYAAQLSKAEREIATYC